MNEVILDSPFDAHMHWREKRTIMHNVAPYSIQQFLGLLKKLHNF